MIQKGKPPKIFLDTSVIIAAVLSRTGGARELFYLGEAGILHLCVGENVLRECEAVIRRKIPSSLPTLARLLETGLVETSPAPDEKLIDLARSIVDYEPDAYVLAEAIEAEPDWFIAHDKRHYLREAGVYKLYFQVGTPGDLLQSFRDDLTVS